MSGSHAPVTRSLLALRVLVLALVIVNVPQLRSPEAERMREIVAAPGRPYRDVAIEYPIGDLPLIRAVGSNATDDARIALALIAFTADLIAFAAVGRGWGRAAAARYLLYGAPLLVFIYRRSDLVPVALATVAFAFVRRGRERGGGVALGVAALVKLWPLVLAPALLVTRHFRSFVAFVATFTVGVVLWVAVGGPSALTQVTSFRGATGWELESGVGAVVWALTGTYRFEAGANRTGSVPGWSKAILLAILVAGLAAIWWRARARTVDPVGLPALAAVALLLVAAPVLSPQYLCWLVPWAAVGAADDRRLGRLAVIPIGLTGAIMAAWFLGLTHGHPLWSQTALIVRNLTLLVVPVAWMWRSADPPSSGPGARARMSLP
jgi:hypothetical protein